MPKAVVELSEHANRVVNVVKARDGLRGKSEAIERIVEEYEEKILDPAFRPEFVEDVKRVLKGPFKRGKSLNEVLR
ncbi:MAG TPA: antitoxin [Candidatus Thermoplasmatota archaeon]